MTDRDRSETSETRQRFAEAARSQKPDLATLCLLVGAVIGASPRDVPLREAERTVDEGEIELDRLTGMLPFATDRSPKEWAYTLGELLGERQGFGGGASDYQHLASSLLGEVLRRRRGLPILLSVVWIEVARRAGAPVHGVALPGHFVVGFGDPAEELVLVDPFAGGQLLSNEEAELLVSGATGHSLSRAMLQPAQPLETVLRVLNNIRSWASGRPERADVQLAAIDLSLMLPHHPARLRYERAKALVDKGEFLDGASELDAYAALVSAVEPGVADVARREAAAARARLN